MTFPGDHLTQAVDGPAYFGGPDQARGTLRDLLAERIAAVPSGGRIDWVAYYFRDRELAAALIDAASRGVTVCCSLDAAPRQAGANDAVIGLLQRAPNVSLALANRRSGMTRWLPPLRLHEKLYVFSGPNPHCLVGSFNPSSDAPELDPDAIAAIGDHDIAFNLLVDLNESAVVAALGAHAQRLHRRLQGAWTGCAGSSQRIVTGSAETQLHYFPRFSRHPVDQIVNRLRSGDSVRICASHIKGRAVSGLLRRALGRGVGVEIAAEATARRTPPRLLQELELAGARVQRIVADPDAWIPMHCKFVLIEGAFGRRSIFGSFNWNQRSRWLNRELAVVSDSPTLYAALDARWQALQAFALPVDTPLTPQKSLSGEPSSDH